MRSKVKKIKIVIKRIIKAYIEALKVCMNHINILWEKINNNKYSKYVFNFFPKNIILFIFSIISFFILFNTYKNNNIEYLYNQRLFNDTYGPIITEEQKFNLDRYEISKNPENVCIKFATYARINNAEYKYIIYYKDEIIYEELFNANILVDGDYKCFDARNIQIENDLKNLSLNLINLFICLQII